MSIPFALTAILVFFMGCQQPPLKIGFLGSLTGRQSDLALAGRNGATLRLEEENALGGVDGRRLQFVEKNDRGEPEGVGALIDAFVEEGVNVVIGPYLSSVAAEVVKAADRRRMLFLSPTVSASQFDDKIDSLIRFNASTSATAEELGKTAAARLGLSRVNVLYDRTNRQFSIEFYNAFKAAFEDAGGRCGAPAYFDSGDKDLRYIDQARILTGPPHDGLLLIAGAYDTAMLCQQLRKLGDKTLILVSGWALTGDLFAIGGDAIEGIVVAQSYELDGNEASLVSFKERYRSQFKSEPTFSAIQSYEAVSALIAALKRTADRSGAGIAATLLSIGDLPGLSEPIRLSPAGDPIRRKFLYTIKRGRIERLR